jgi:enamine deaminase RidA (YjgF/YER057c/UK114 family)
MTRRVLQPAGWPRPSGYADGIAASGRLVFTAGVVGWDATQKFAPDFVGQFRQALLNTREILAEGDARPQHIVRMTCYVTDIDAYRSSAREIGAAWREAFGRVYPCMALVGVAALVEREALVEIETTAVVDD